MNLSANVCSLPLSGNTHAHDFHQLVLGLQGRAEIEISGRCDQVSPYQGCIAPASVTHAYQGERNNRMLVLDLNLAETAATLENGNIPTNTQPLPLRYGALFDKPTYFAIDAPLRQLVTYYIQEREQFGPDPRLLLPVGNLLLHSLHQRLNPGTSHPAPRKPLDMAIIDRYILSNLSRKISVPSLAALVHLSASHFHALFKQTTGLPPHQYLLKIRLDAARNLLRDSSLSLIQVAEQTGFSSQSALSHALKQHFGATPTQLRRARPHC